MNFTPVGAITLFGGIYLPKRFALFVPIGAMYVSDMFIGFYDAKIMLAVYGSFILTGIMGFSIRKRKNVATIIGGTLAGSLLFFLITNAAVWAFGDMYAHTLAGLEESYIAALPFFRNSALGDIFYTGMLVGSFEGMRYILVTLKRRRAPASAHPFFG